MHSLTHLVEAAVVVACFLPHMESTSVPENFALDWACTENPASIRVERRSALLNRFIGKTPVDPKRIGGEAGSL
jgi:hypothetical protein